MYYELNIKEDFNVKDAKYIDQSSYAGICVAKKMTISELQKVKKISIDLPVAKQIYSRIDVHIDTSSPSNLSFKQHGKADMLVAVLDSFMNIEKVIQARPDMVSFNFADPSLKFKFSQIKSIIRQKIFFEVPISSALYDSKARIVWIGNVRKLLKFTNGKNVVVTSAAKEGTEIKKPRDIKRMLGIFGLSEKKAAGVMRNSERLLLQCAMRRYTYKNCLACDMEEGNLKRDFILKRFGEFA